MGVDRTTHIEAFIKIPIQYEDGVETIRTCGKHRDYKKTLYCPECGKPITIKEQTTKYVVHPEDLIGNDNLYPYFEHETMYLFSNTYNCGIELLENDMNIITGNLIKEKIRIFKEQHGNEITILKDKLGIDVKVEFCALYEVS